MRGTALALLLATTGLAADTGIYRCQLDDGTGIASFILEHCDLAAAD